MLYKLLTDDDIDLSDYILSINSVPFLTKNRDFSLIAEGYDFELSNQCSVIPESGDKLFFYREEELIHYGVVDYTEFDEDNLIYSVKVKHLLSELQDRDTKDNKINDFGGGETTFIAGLLVNATYPVTIEGIEVRLISYIELINLIFSEIQTDNITLDWGDVVENKYYDDEVLPVCEWTGNRVATSDGEFEISDVLDLSDIWFLPEQINCTGQNGVYGYTLIVGDGMDRKRPTLFELLSILCSLCGICFVPKDKTTFYVVSPKTSAAGIFEDGDIYEIQNAEELTDATGIESKYNTLTLTLWFGGISSGAWSSASVYYPIGSLVTYDGKVWKCFMPNISNPLSYPGNTNYYFWYYWRETAVGVLDYYQSYEPEKNGTDDSFWTEYISLQGVKADTLDWYDNFNPILINATEDAWVCTPVVDTDKTCAYYIKIAKLNSFNKVTMITKASLVLGATFYEYESVYINDINTDTVEVEYVE